MNIKTGFKLTQTLVFDDEIFDWHLETTLETDDGFEESQGLEPFASNAHPTFKDCKDEINELFGYLAETYKKPKKEKKRKCVSSK